MKKPKPTWTIKYKESPTNEDLGLSSLLSVAVGKGQEARESKSKAIAQFESLEGKSWEPLSDPSMPTSQKESPY